MKITLIVILFLIVSCASADKKDIDYSNLGEPIERDFIDQLESIGPDYLANEETREVKLSSDSSQFLHQIYERIVTNNELLFTNEYKPKFHVIVNKIPFIFSLPRAHFFISTGLIEKYLKSEELFVAALTAEILKSNRNIYEKKLMIPLGHYNTEKMIFLTRLKQETRYKINEWTYIVLKRSGYDPSAYLNWIQVQNRNTLDFSLYLGDAVGISKEEHFFKNFMTRQGVVGVEKKINEANSSKSFYKLLTNVAGNK